MIFRKINTEETFFAIYRVAQIKIPHRTKRNFSTTVWDFYTQISWFIWERSCYNSDFLKLKFHISPKLWLYKYSMPYVQFCTEWSTETCNFHCQETLTVITNTKIWQVVHFSVCSKCPPTAFTQSEVFSGSSIWLCSTGRRACRHGNADWRLNCYQLQWIHC